MVLRFVAKNDLEGVAGEDGGALGGLERLGAGGLVGGARALLLHRLWGAEECAAFA